jgi:uncharacterized metal-binding protein YceD (DUF177 family)
MCLRFRVSPMNLRKARCSVESPDDGPRGGMSLQLAISGEVELTCQRCLAACGIVVEIVRTLHLARNEVELERLDALPDS